MVLMKRIILILLLSSLVFGYGCSAENIPHSKNPVQEPGQEFSSEEKQRMALYIEVMKATFQEENGGNEFVAVEIDTLEGLSDPAKQAVLSALIDLSPNVYSLAEVKNDPTKFQLDEEGRLVRSIDGTLLSVNIKEYGEGKAIITGISWFGNLGAVFPKYEAVFKDGEWHLKLISMGIS